MKVNVRCPHCEDNSNVVAFQIDIGKEFYSGCMKCDIYTKGYSVVEALCKFNSGDISVTGRYNWTVRKELLCDVYERASVSKPLQIKDYFYKLQTETLFQIRILIQLGLIDGEFVWDDFTVRGLTKKGRGLLFLMRTRMGYVLRKRGYVELALDSDPYSSNLSEWGFSKEDLNDGFEGSGFSIEDAY